MTTSPAVVLTAYLVEQDLLTFPDENGDWPVTTTTLPSDDPDNRVVITDLDPEIQGKNHRTGETYLSEMCQIRVRSNPSSAGYTKIRELLAALSPITPVNVTVDGPGDQAIIVTLVSVTLVSGPAYMGQDERNTRQHHVMTVKVIIVPGE